MTRSSSPTTSALPYTQLAGDAQDLDPCAAISRRLALALSHGGINLSSPSVDPFGLRSHGGLTVDLLPCGHHYGTSRVALTAADAVIIDDRLRGGTSVNEHETDDPTVADTTPQR
jgi:hypothetical protein